MDVAELRAIELCEGLSDEQLLSLSEVGVDHPFAAGEELFHEGAAADVWWVLLAGSISLHRRLGSEEDVRKAYRALVAAGAHIVGSSDHGVSKSLYLTDPDGLGIEVYADRPRSEWHRDGRQLLMATEPLDVRGVVAAAGGEQWSGMPDGTRLGHVHLFVANLDEGEKFYHAGLGFDKVVWSYPGALFLSAGGYHHHLGTNTWAQHASPATDHDARLLDWEIVVPAATTDCANR